jgi:hypothetical protein
MLERRIYETGLSSLLPTPTASSYGTSGNGCPGDGRESYAHKGKASLETMAKRNLLPTPMAAYGQKGKGRHRGANAQGGPTLHMALLPTPTAGDAKASGSRCTEDSQAHPGTSLTDAVVRGTNAGASEAHGHLNPRFVEWMMGLCPDWTRHDCDPLETPLFRRKAKSSPR